MTGTHAVRSDSSLMLTCSEYWLKVLFLVITCRSPASVQQSYRLEYLCVTACAGLFVSGCNKTSVVSASLNASYRKNWRDLWGRGAGPEMRQERCVVFIYSRLLLTNQKKGWKKRGEEEETPLWDAHKAHPPPHKIPHNAVRLNLNLSPCNICFPDSTAAPSVLARWSFLLQTEERGFSELGTHRSVNASRLKT